MKSTATAEIVDEPIDVTRAIVLEQVRVILQVRDAPGQGALRPAISWRHSVSCGSSSSASHSSRSGKASRDQRRPKSEKTSVRMTERSRQVASGTYSDQFPRWM